MTKRPRHRAEGVLSRSVVGALAGAARQVERALAGCCDAVAAVRTNEAMARRVLDGGVGVNRGTASVPNDEGVGLPASIGDGLRSG